MIDKKLQPKRPSNTGWQERVRKEKRNHRIIVYYNRELLVVSSIGVTKHGRPVWILGVSGRKGHVVTEQDISRVRSDFRVEGATREEGNMLKLFVDEGN